MKRADVNPRMWTHWARQQSKQEIYVKFADELRFAVFCLLLRSYAFRKPLSFKIMEFHSCQYMDFKQQEICLFGVVQEIVCLITGFS